MPNSSDILEQYFHQLNDASIIRLAKHYLQDELYRKDKKDLITKLISFLQSESTQQTLLLLLDSDDIEILHALYSYHQYTQSQPMPKQKELQSLLNLLYPWKEQKLLIKLQNLQDRLWVIKHPHDKTLQINPILLPMLLEHHFNQTHYHMDETLLTKHSLPINLSLIQAFLTIIFSKSPQERSLDILSTHLHPHLSRGMIQSLLHALHKLNIINELDQINIILLEQLCSLSSPRIIAIIYSTMICIEEETIEFNPLTDLLTYLLSTSPKLWHSNDLMRLYYFWSETRTPIHTEALLSTLQYHHILQQDPENQNYYINTEYTYQISTLHIEANLSFFYPYDHSLEFIPIISSRLIRYDTFSQYILEKSYFIKAVEVGYNSQLLKQFYIDISDNPELLEQTFNYWLSSTASFILYQGYIMHIQALYKHLLDNPEFIEKFVLQIINKECILLKKAPDASFYSFFEKNALPRPLLFKENDKYEETNIISPSMQDLKATESFKMFPHYREHTKVVEQQSLSHPNKDHYKQILMERKLILNDDQLYHISFFRQQASGLDFQAKTRLIELAIKENKDLYLQIKQSTGEKELHILPMHFDKKTTLLLKAYDYRVEKFVSIHANAMLHIEIIERSLIY
ncbi:hypothetical protein PVA44_05675 [Entomospira nematocerorum]|uniref:Helicase XPB/Ssl2 N-terminal domain-containing protein n=1 Tax=Entomospira nematocerorum TaxID=2719987 RepID=A0A968GAV2_9SPIO|nr:hypothetical protein [Entomospira nematocera]NIZ46492.1 hypothetical protein [Entomospira nematocera]WDI33707.1 hypothetical protein PVA44_05675 [Entomospira nematocera]